MYKYRWTVISFICMASILSACVQFTPTSINDRIGQGYSEITTIAEKVREEYQLGNISTETARKAQDALREAKHALDLAREAYEGNDVDRANALLNLVSVSLQGVIKNVE